MGLADRLHPWPPIQHVHATHLTHPSSTRFQQRVPRRQFTLIHAVAHHAAHGGEPDDGQPMEPSRLGGGKRRRQTTPRRRQPIRPSLQQTSPIHGGQATYSRIPHIHAKPPDHRSHAVHASAQRRTAPARKTADTNRRHKRKRKNTKHENTKYENTKRNSRQSNTEKANKQTKGEGPWERNKPMDNNMHRY